MRQALFQVAVPVRIALSLSLLVVISTSTGCVAVDAVKDYCRYNDNTNDFVMGWRNSVWARQAWHAQQEQFVGHPQFHAFGEGFRDGYVAVASGGNGCPPPLPPRKFWNWRYQTPEGQAQVAAWWEGFPYGAKVADEDGAGLYQQIQVSHAIEVQYSPEFLNQTVPQQAPTRPGERPAPTPPPGSQFEQVFPGPLGAPGGPALPAPNGPAFPGPESGASFNRRPEADQIPPMNRFPPVADGPPSRSLSSVNGGPIREPTQNGPPPMALIGGLPPAGSGPLRETQALAMTRPAGSIASSDLPLWITGGSPPDSLPRGQAAAMH